jgi:serine/threonine protein kinase
MNEARPGSRVGEYVLEAEIGRGGHGRVWRARHVLLPDRRVALKLAESADHVPLLGRTAADQGRLRSRHVVRVLGADLGSEPAHLALELVEGESLRVRMRRGAFSVASALEILDAVLDALVEAHEAGIVHGDLKPENILVDRNGEVKVTDFGLGPRSGEGGDEVALSHTVRLDSGEVRGTLLYMAPEQLRGLPVDGQNRPLRPGARALRDARRGPPGGWRDAVPVPRGRPGERRPRLRGMLRPPREALSRRGGDARAGAEGSWRAPRLGSSDRAGAAS